METLRIRFEHFWPGFDLLEFQRRFCFLLRDYRLVTSDSPDVVFYSCFDQGQKLSRPPVVQGPGLKVFYSAENMRPNLETCDYALTFCRDIESDRHLRFPNWVQRLYRDGHTPAALVRRNDDVEAILAKKRRFCAFVQGNDVAFRNDFVTTLSRARSVDCLGPSLNNVGGLLPRSQTLSCLESYRFVVAFENESSPGYVTEKIVNSMLARAVPLYWGAPDVHRDFNPGSFLDAGRFASQDDFIDAVLRLDDDAELYRSVLSQPYYHRDRIPEYCDPEQFLPFFDRMFREAISRRSSAIPAVQVGGLEW